MLSLHKKHRMVLSDTAQLISDIRAGNRQAMHDLYSLSVGRLTAVCRRYVVEDEDVKDVMQDSYVKIFRALNTFVPQNDNSLMAWMTRIVVNESLNFLRQRSRIIWLDGGTDRLSDMACTDDEEPDTFGISTEQLYGMICRLPDGYRTVINLYVIENLSHKEIARMLNISEYTSASQLLRAKRALAKMIKKRKLDE